MIVLYGIRNCDRCRKAQSFLDEQGLACRFHDLRTDGLEAARLDRWIAALGWEKLLNRQSTTWRNLPETDRDGLDEASARSLLLAHPTLIKRPVIELDQDYLVGFGKAEQARLSSL